MMLTVKELPSALKSAITHHEVAKDQILFQQGEPTQAIFWVESGRLKLVSFTDQQMITHYSVGAGESFAETALYFDTYACTAIAQQPSRVTAIPKQVFLEALRQFPSLSEQYLAHLTHRFSKEVSPSTKNGSTVEASTALKVAKCHHLQRSIKNVNQRLQT